jgi:glycosyltransferase involved in cell wall biosynthesis
MVEFSVVIPTYRRPRALAEALASVLRQVRVTLEVVVLDDCPNGSGFEAVAGINDARVSYIRNPNPSGGVPSIVRNLACAFINGIFVHFLDDDDIVPDGHYELVRDAFARRSDIGLIFGRIEPFGTAPAAQLEHERNYFADAAHIAEICGWFGSRRAFAARMLFGRPILVCSAGVIRRCCMDQVGGFDPEIRLMEDADFYARIIRHCGACFLPSISLRYRIGSPSLMHAPNASPLQLQQQRAGRRRMQAKYRRLYGLMEFYALAVFARGLLTLLGLVIRKSPQNIHGSHTASHLSA